MMSLRMFSHKKALLLLCFFTASVLLIIQTAANMRDATDAWILDGLVPYFLFFVLSYSVLVSYLPDLKSIALITSTFLVVINLIPNLKYIFVYGYFDPLGHVGFMNEIVRTGQLPGSGIGFYAAQYGSSPGMQILVSALSLETGLGIVTAIKVFLVASPFIAPLAIYHVLKRIDMRFDVAKIIIISTALTAPLTYIYNGTTSVYFLFLLFVSLFLVSASSGKRERAELIVFILLGFAIVVSHDFTSFFLLLYMGTALFLLVIAKATGSHLLAGFTRFSSIFALVFVIIGSAHLVFSSGANLTNILNQIRELALSIFAGKGLVAIGYYGGFYQLTLLERMRVLIVRFAGYALLVLILFAPLAYRRLRLTSSGLTRFYQAIIIPVLLASLVFFLPLFLHPLVYRGLYYLAAFSPFLVGLTLAYFFSRNCRGRHIAISIVLFSLISVSFLQTYVFQPLIPRVPTGSGNYYVVDWRQVNTVYDRSAILFVAAHDSELRVWTDAIVSWQLLSLTNSTFQSLTTWQTEYPALYPLVLISHTGLAHSIASGRDASANDQYLQDSLQRCAVIYDNGESYALLNTTALARTGH